MSLNADRKEQFFCVLVSFFLTVPYIVSPGLYLLRNSCISKRRLLKVQKNFPPNPLLGWPLSFFYSSPFPPVRIACLAGATVGSTSSFLPSRARLRYFSLHPKKMARSTQAPIRNIEATNLIKIGHIIL